MRRAGSDRCTSDNGARLERKRKEKKKKKKTTCFYIPEYVTSPTVVI